ncbi:MAG: TonB-dependent receptor [Candidatus Azobacteroides sp.]|nr:TonB-dependent receptor [Candidatus Azobacteroides sp.]
MNRIFKIVFFCAAYLNVYSQSQVKVLDKETQEPVMHASVYFPDSKTGTETDESGNFTFETKANSVLVQISSIGYKTYLETLKLNDDTLSVFLEPSLHDLQEIVVSGSSSRLQGENVANVEIVSLNNNAQMQGISLSQKLSETPGISNLSTGAGIGKPVIRGFSGNRIAVFSQGIRVENQQWGDEHGLGLDENGYEQVEIIKGPASLLYGSDALGGVLFFVGERYAIANSLEATFHSEYNTNTEGWRNTGSFKLSKGKFHWNLFGSHTTHQDYEEGNDEWVDNSRFHTTDFKTTFGYTLGKFITSLKYNYLNEKYGLLETRENDGIAKRRNGRNPVLPYQLLTTHLVSSENTFFFDNESKLQVDLGSVFNNRKEFEDEQAEAVNNQQKAALDMNLSTVSYNAKWTSPEINNRWIWILGTQGMYQINKNKGEEVLIPDVETVDIGFYTTADYHYTQESYWQAGVRIDERFIDGKSRGTSDNEQYFPSLSKTYSAFNFSTGIFQQLPQHFSLRLSLSSGFRAPNMFELLSNGIHEGTNRYEIGNQNLKTENCYQADWSLDYKVRHFEFSVNPYFNYIRNYIFLEPSGEIKEHFPVYDYKQRDAYLFGGEAVIHFHPHPLDWLHLEVSYSSAYGQDKDGNCLPLMPSSKINSTVNASFSEKKAMNKLSAFLQYQYSFKQNRIAEYEMPTDAYSLINTGVYLDFNIHKYKFRADVVVNNLLNKCYYDHLSRYKAEGIYNIGRNFIFKLTVPIHATLENK